MATFSLSISPSLGDDLVGSFLNNFFTLQKIITYLKWTVPLEANVKSVVFNVKTIFTVSKSQCKNIF